MNQLIPFIKEMSQNVVYVTYIHIQHIDTCILFIFYNTE